jgi:hypothetical protein
LAPTYEGNLAQPNLVEDALDLAKSTKAFGNFDLLLDIFRTMDSFKVDWCGIGESNQLHNGFGWDSGIQKALAENYKMFATGLVPFNSNNGTGTEMGYKYDRMFAFGLNSGAPAGLEAIVGATPPCGMHDYSYNADAVSTGINPPVGLEIDLDCPLDVNANLTGEWHYGTFITGVGEFKPAFMNFDDSGGVQEGNLVLTVTGAETMQREDHSVTATVRTQGRKMVYRAVNGNPFNKKVEGPYFFTYLRCINTDRNAGFSFGTIYDVGSRDLYDMAVAFQATSDAWYTYYFSQLRRIQLNTQGFVKIVIIINSGTNDRSETNTSVGPNAITDGDSASAYEDNGQAIIDKFRAEWILNAWPLSELNFIFMPTHPQGDPDDAEQASYQDACRGLAQDNARVCSIDLSRLSNGTDYVDRGWYDGGGASQPHLEEDGYYEAFAQVIATIRGSA